MSKQNSKPRNCIAFDLRNNALYRLKKIKNKKLYTRRSKHKESINVNKYN